MAKPVNKIGKSVQDRAHDVLRSEGHPLDAIFTPHNVAVVGATDRVGSIGRAVMWSLVSSPFGGTVYPVSDKRNSVLGIKAYSHIADIPEPVDLAVIVTPAVTVPDIITECVKSGVRGAIVISAGFKEHGEAGKELERQILQRVRGSGMRVVGPNCLGVMNPISGLNATFAPHIARPGNVAFISQSGALCTAILDWCQKEMVGFSAFVSVGSMLDVGWGDLIDYLGNDPRTHSIVMYMESVGDARSFLSAAREVTLNKPVIIIKAGRTEAAAHAAASHTGSLTGSDEVLEAAFRRIGRAAGQHHCRSFLHGRCAVEAAASQGTEARDRDQRGWAGRAGCGFADCQWRQLWPSCRPKSMQELDADASAALEPQQSHGHSGRRSAGAIREGGADRSGRSRTSMRCLAIICPQGIRRADANRGADEGHCPKHRGKPCWRVGWAAPKSRPGATF